MHAHATSVPRARPGVAALAPGGADTLGLGARAAAQLMLLPLRLLASRLGRRLTAVAVLMLLLGSFVSTLYDHADPSAAGGRLRAVAVPAAAKRTADAHRTNAGAVVRQVGQRPDEVAADWFARTQHVARDKVQSLQQRRVNSRTTEVLVMADAGKGKMPTAYVTVKLGTSGWAVA